ncbi:MAG: UDP-N-acetylglucosamine 1-carboxyvinyltransferase [Candidatus Levybacteria bacterium]|nr:UDP-N-acetylglucosamine 1-carboxyvinyltransferase [Candidatus Levybacteria bacterium]
MDTFIVHGGKKLKGEISVSGAKNVALKVLVASCLTADTVIIHNIPHISEVSIIINIIKSLGGIVDIDGHTVSITVASVNNFEVPLDKAAKSRSSSLFIAALLTRFGEAIVPNPGGCRIGARPIDRTVEGLKILGAEIAYHSEDGYFHAKIKNGATRLRGSIYRFDKNSHTGTETLIIAAVLAEGRTIIENAAAEPEVDELISLLVAMGARIKRTELRTIIIDGVKKLNGASFTIGPDRNEVITLAIAGIITGGDVIIKNVKKQDILEFIKKIEIAGGGCEIVKNGIRFFSKGPLSPTDITTAPFPGFMTDWQSPWAVLMTQAEGISIIHESVYESRFSYVEELRKMGAQIELFNPEVLNPQKFYNFNLNDDKEDNFHAAKIYGPTILHNSIVTISDLRAGATIVLAALAAKGKSVIFGVDQIDRGYENLEIRLNQLGADIIREKNE